MPPVLQRWLPVALVVAFALGLRIWDLDRRPMHADEANQAVKAGELLGGRGYAFDPADHHGPTLYYAVLPVAWLRGEHSLAELTETTVRLVPALAGTAAVLLLYLLALPLGIRPALLAAALLTLSPPAVYYSRYFVQETLLLAFTLGALLCAAQWWRTGRLGWAVGTGLCVGLMQATKSSTPLFFLAALAGLALARLARAVSARPRRDIAFALAAAVLVAGLFYSSFGANWRGVPDAVATYFSFGNRLAAGTGHEKPWWYYLALFGWRQDGGVVTHQIAFTALALAGVGVALLPRSNPLLRGAAGFTAVLLLAFSAIAYKTPWHAIHLVPGLALLSAGAIGAMPERWRQGGNLVLFVVLYTLGSQVKLTSFQRPADERNPYAYVHTSPDVLKVRPLIAAAQTREPGRPVRIISEEVWPLPWYLRNLPDVGYWTSVPAECDGALVVASAGLADQVQARFKDRYTTAFVGLRPGFTLVVFTRQP